MVLHRIFKALGRKEAIQSDAKSKGDPTPLLIEPKLTASTLHSQIGELEGGQRVTPGNPREIAGGSSEMVGSELTSITDPTDATKTNDVRTAQIEAFLGDTARDSGSWTRAMPHYRQALKLDPSLWAIWVQLGHGSKETGDFGEAEASYRRSIDIRPDVADTHLQLGHVLKLTSRLRDAYDSYLKAYALDRTDPRMQLEIAALAGQFDTNISNDLDQFIELPPLSAVELLGSASDITRLLLDVTALISGVENTLRPALKQVLAGAGAVDMPFTAIRWDRTLDAFVQLKPSWTLDTGFDTSSGDDDEVLVPEANFLNSIVLVCAPVQNQAANHELFLLRISRTLSARMLFSVVDFSTLLSTEPRVHAERKRFSALVEALNTRVLVENEMCVPHLRYVLDGKAQQVGVQPMMVGASDVKSYASAEMKSILVLGTSNAHLLAEVSRALEQMKPRVKVYKEINPTKALDMLKGKLNGSFRVLALSGEPDTIVVAAWLASQGIPVAISELPDCLPAWSAASMVLTSEDLHAKDLFDRLNDMRSADLTPISGPYGWGPQAVELAKNMDCEPRVGKSVGRIANQLLALRLDDGANNIKGLRKSGLDVKVTETAWSSSGVRLSASPTQLRLASGIAASLEQHLMLLVVATRKANITVWAGEHGHLKSSKAEASESIALEAGDSTWIDIRVVADSEGKLDLQLSADGNPSAGHVTSVAVCFIGLGEEFIWMRIQDEIAQGKYPFLRETVFQTRFDVLGAASAA